MKIQYILFREKKTRDKKIPIVNNNGRIRFLRSVVKRYKNNKDLTAPEVAVKTEEVCSLAVV